MGGRGADRLVLMALPPDLSIGIRSNRAVSRVHQSVVRLGAAVLAGLVAAGAALKTGTGPRATVGAKNRRFRVGTCGFGQLES
jgi:hypothetical protein